MYNRELHKPFILWHPSRQIRQYPGKLVNPAAQGLDMLADGSMDFHIGCFARVSFSFN